MYKKVPLYNNARCTHTQVIHSAMFNFDEVQTGTVKFTTLSQGSGYCGQESRSKLEVNRKGASRDW